MSQVQQGQIQSENRAKKKKGIFILSACHTGRTCRSQSISSALHFLLFQGALHEKQKGLQHLVIHPHHHRGSLAFPRFPSSFQGPTAANWEEKSFRMIPTALETLGSFP